MFVLLVRVEEIDQPLLVFLGAAAKIQPRINPAGIVLLIIVLLLFVENDT